MKKEKKETFENDQGHIIEACKKGDYLYVWKHVKYIGYKDEPDITSRYLIFRKTFEDFNPERNNNFIWFYKRYIKFLRDTPTLFTDKRNYEKIIAELDAPTGNASKYVEDIKGVSWY